MKSLSKSIDRRKPIPQKTGLTRIKISAKGRRKGGWGGHTKNEDSHQPSSVNQQQLAVSYVGPMTPWRCSYRMVIPKEESDCSLLSSAAKAGGSRPPAKDAKGDHSFDDCGVDDVSLDSSDGRVMMHVFGNGKKEQPAKT